MYRVVSVFFLCVFFRWLAIFRGQCCRPCLLFVSILFRLCSIAVLTTPAAFSGTRVCTILYEYSRLDQQQGTRCTRWSFLLPLFLVGVFSCPLRFYLVPQKASSASVFYRATAVSVGDTSTGCSSGRATCRLVLAMLE